MEKELFHQNAHETIYANKGTTNFFHMPTSSLSNPLSSDPRSTFKMLGSNFWGDKVGSMKAITWILIKYLFISMKKM